MSRTISLDEIREIAKFVNEFTDGAFRNAPFNRPGDSKGWRFHEGVSQKQWFGAEGGRSLYSGYMIGFALEWARLSGQAIPAETRELMQSVECRFSRRYDSLGRSEMDNGRVVAAERWWSRNVLSVTNDQGIEFNVVLRKDEAGNVAMWQVQVYDTRYDHTEFGQFTGGSAYVTTLLGLGAHGAGLGCDTAGICPWASTLGAWTARTLCGSGSGWAGPPRPPVTSWAVPREGPQGRHPGDRFDGQLTSVDGSEPNP